jgi:NHLM bacteriocin system ABC transporter ATP-binding protein
LRLDDPDTAWRVLSGRVQVFAVELDSDGGWSNTAQRERLGLFSASIGNVLFPFPQGHGVGLLIAGMEPETEVGPVAVAELRSAASTAGSGVAGLVEDWLESATSALPGVMPPGGISIVAGDEVEIAASQPAWPATRTAWAPSDGRLSPFTQAPEELQEQPASSPREGEVSSADQPGVLPALSIPVPPGAWVVNTGPPWRTVPVTGEEALAASAGWEGFSVLSGAIADQVAALVRSRSQGSSTRQVALARHEKSLNADTFSALAGVLDRRRIPTAAAGEHGALAAAFGLIAENLGVELAPINQATLDGTPDPLDALTRISGMRSRQVVLEQNWWKRDCGPILLVKGGGGYAAAIPAGANRYRMIDPDTGETKRMTASLAASFAPAATSFYRPLPLDDLTGRQVLRYVLRPLKGDLRYLGFFALIVGVLSLVAPLVTKTVFSTVVPGLMRPEMWWLVGLMIFLAVASFGIGVAQQFAVLRVEGRSSTDLQAALWDRLLDLPLPFFRKFTAGDLTMRVMGIEQIRSLATSTVTTALLAVSVGLANLVLAFVLQPRLALFGLGVVLVGVVVMVYVTRYQLSRQKLVVAANLSLFATAMELIGAVGKLRTADAEVRGFARWAEQFGRLKSSFYDAQLGFIAMTSFTAGAMAIGSMLVFLGAATLPVGAITAATFLAFNTAFSQAVGSIMNLSSVATFLAQATPVYDNIRPILDASRETDEVRGDPGDLRGAIDVSHVSLRYGADLPLVLEDLSFRVAPGEMVAVVGPSGAGKSSIMRVLLGFEVPEMGSVRIDGADLSSLDLRAVRRQTGVVLQSARLMPGNIFSNIVGTRPLTLDDAWEAAKIAGIDEDIRAMPMGMHTFVAEGASTFSGGQRQRLLIARAVVGKPKILLFDEATSALDNRTQAGVTSSIARLRATRLVIAHRLSTVEMADRVLVIDAGRLVQEGGFEELLETDGLFRDLARRQLLA